MYKQTPVNANGAGLSPLAALPLLPFLVSTPLLISSLDNRPNAACKDLLVTGPYPCSPNGLWPAFVYQHRGRRLGPNKPESTAKLLRL